MSKQTIITIDSALGSNASPFIVMMNITQELCCSTCVESTPVFKPEIIYRGYSKLQANTYMINLHVEGVISYNPCDGNKCCGKSQLISQEISIPLYSTTDPETITVTTGNAVNGIARRGCRPCSDVFVSEVPITITVA